MIRSALRNSLLIAGIVASIGTFAQELYRVPEGIETRWSSFENHNAAKGKGGSENKKAKGHPMEFMAPGETKVLLDTKGAGVVQRIWITVSERAPAMLRALRIEMFWDDATKPAVSVPLGDFFGVGLGRKTAFENALFADPEGRSFNSYIPMPFRKAAKIVLINESDKQVTLFYDVNFLTVKSHAADVMYFHAYWSRAMKSALGADYAILPKVTGRGRYLGMNMGVITDPLYEKSWFGEGEVKIYLDGDGDLPTLNGTGTEDYIGTGWGQGVFANQYQGCLVADESNRQWTFYRYHIPDPVYFSADCKVTIQLMGGEMRDKVRSYVKNGAKLLPVTISLPKDLLKLLDKPMSLDDPEFPDGWVNFYRSDDVSATAYFYLDKPSGNLPPIANVAERTKGLAEK